MIQFLNVTQKHSDNLKKFGIEHQFAFGQITIKIKLSPQERVNEVLVDMLKYIAEIDAKTKYKVSDVTKTTSLINNTITDAENVTPEIITNSFSMKALTIYLLKAHETNARQQFSRFSKRHNLHKYGTLPAITLSRPLPEYADNIAVHEGVYFNFAKTSEPKTIKIPRPRPFIHSLESIRDCDEQIQYLFENINILTDLQLLWFMTNIIDYQAARTVINQLKKRDGRIAVFYKIAKDMYFEPLAYSKVIGDGKFRFDYVYQAVNDPLVRTMQIAPSPVAIDHGEIGKKLEEIFKSCLNDPTKRIHLIRLDTGTGKTTVSMRYMNYNMAYIAPTHRLILQSIEELKKFNPCLVEYVVYIPQIDDDELPDCVLKKKLLKARKLNLTKRVKQLQKTIIEKYGSQELKEKYKEYVDALQKTEGVPFITHQRFAITNMFKNHFQNINTFLIDEDPVKVIFPSVEHTNDFVVNELKNFIDFCTKKYKLHANSKKGKVQKKLEIIAGIKKLINLIKSNETLSVNHGEQFFKRNIDSIQKISSEMMDSKAPQNIDYTSVLTCRFIVRKQNGKATKFYQDNSEFFRDKKVIVMSATLDSKVHIPLFAKNINPDLRWHEVGRTKNVGNIYCYTDFSTTKAAFASNPKYIDKINNVIKTLPVDNVLTYKDFKDLFPYETEEMHFYNSSGYNDLSGKNIAVIGTPNTQIEEVVAFGYLITGKLPESYVGPKLVLTSQAVIKDEFKFSFYTFANKEDEQFRRVHIWSTYNELIQAVGRARAVHHDCNVYVFSRLPVPQCHIKKYPEAI
ncbi:hypothetical protein [Bacillus weihaiensis]|uniref:hypothetical protein n=1 Tax=Bacillus weihaiensis TaxID=1547283 RepID=UPI0023550BCA|nr:hypothetical protein [Bacillus weihaiensis]